MQNSFLENSLMPAGIADKNASVIWINDICKTKYPIFKTTKSFSVLFSKENFDFLIENFAKNASFEIDIVNFSLEFTTFSFSPDEDGNFVFFILDKNMKYSPEKSRGLADLSQISTSTSSLIRQQLSMIFSCLIPVNNIIHNSGISDGEKYLDVISKSGYNILKLQKCTDYLYDFTNDSHAFSKFANIDIASWLTEYIKTVKALLKNCDVPIISDIPDVPIYANVNIERLSVAISELILNSLIFTKEGNEITISLIKSGSRAVVTVADKGIGVSEENLPNISSPFFSYKEGESHPQRLGIGLTIVHSILSTMGGTVLISSKKYEGTKVSLSLPIINEIPAVVESPPTFNDYIIDRFSPPYIWFSDYIKTHII